MERLSGCSTEWLLRGGERPRFTAARDQGRHAWFRGARDDGTSRRCNRTTRLRSRSNGGGRREGAPRERPSGSEPGALPVPDTGSPSRRDAAATRAASAPEPWVRDRDRGSARARSGDSSAALRRAVCGAAGGPDDLPVPGLRPPRLRAASVGHRPAQAVLAASETSSRGHMSKADRVGV